MQTSSDGSTQARASRLCLTAMGLGSGCDERPRSSSPGCVAGRQAVKRPVSAAKMPSVWDGSQVGVPLAWPSAEVMRSTPPPLGTRYPPPPALRGRNVGAGRGIAGVAARLAAWTAPIGKLCDGLATLRLAQKPLLARHRDQQPSPAHRPTPLNCPQRGRSSAGRAPPLHGGGQGFESPRLHQPLHADSVGASAPTWYHSSGLVIRARWPHPFPSRTRQ